MRKYLSLFVVALCFFPFQTRADDSLFLEYHAQYFSNILETRAENMRQRVPCDTKVVDIKSTGYKIVKEVNFSKQETHPVDGVWFEFVDMNVCGDKMQTKYMVEAQNAKEPRLRLMLPGNSIADPTLQRDAVMYAQIAVSQSESAKGCRNLRVKDTKFIAMQGKGAWQELWTVDACNNAIVTVVTFISTEKGTTVSAKLK